MVISRPGLSPVMVGRSEELRRLLALVSERPEDAASGPQVALVGGEAGIGKSRMLAELRAAVPQTTTVVVGRAGTGAPGRPYSVLLDALEPVVSTWYSVPDALSGRDEPVRALLSGVAPALKAARQRSYAPDEVVRAAVDLVCYVAPPPAVVIFEDLHDADPESITLFGRLGLTADFSGLLVGTYRQEELGIGHPLALTVADLERRRSLVHVSLGRLSRTSVSELLSAVYKTPTPWHVVDAVHRRSDGNPFLIEELLIAAGENEPERLATAVLPWNVTDVVLRRLNGLADVDRAVIDAAVVLGTRFPFELLRSVVGLDDEELLVVLRRLVQRLLLVEEEPDVFDFRHALTREAVAAELLARDRRRLHERALAAMQQLDSDNYAALAHHAAGAGHDDQVAQFARRGGDIYLRLGLVHEALRLAQQGLVQANDDAELHSIASRAAWTIGLPEVARRHGEEWRGLAALEGDASSEGTALRHLGRVEWEAGNPPAAIACAEQALVLAKHHGSREDLALALVVVSEARMLTVAQTPVAGPPDQEQAAAAVRLADQALKLADELGRPDIRPRALVNKGSALTVMPGRVAEGMTVLGAARQEAADLGDAWNHMRALRNVMDGALLIWPPDRIQSALEEQKEIGRRIGREGHADPNWAASAAELAILRGDLATARAHLAEGRRLTPVLYGFERWIYTDLEIALAVEAGELPDAASLLARAHEASDSVEWIGSFATREAELAALEGDLALAAERLVAATCGPGSGSTSWSRRPPILAAGITLLRCGSRPDVVRQAVDALDRRWPAFPDAPSGITHHVEGALLEAEGHPAEALTAYLDALADPFDHRPTHLAADAHQGIARCLLRSGHAGEARGHADRAVSLLEHWPGWRAAQATAVARRCRRSSRAKAGELTPRERDVAALLTEGLTNGEIARRLFISTKTASVHVSNILAKLGMKSRAEIAAWAARQGAVAPESDSRFRR